MVSVSSAIDTLSSIAPAPYLLVALVDTKEVATTTPRVIGTL